MVELSDELNVFIYHIINEVLKTQKSRVFLSQPNTDESMLFNRLRCLINLLFWTVIYTQYMWLQYDCSSADLGRTYYG